MTKKLLPIFTLLFFVCNYAFAQRNNCDNNGGANLTPAATLTTCNPQAWNMPNNYGNYWAPPGTSGCNASVNDDMWGWFDATTTSTTITFQPTDGNDAVMHLFAVDCVANMPQVACRDNAGPGGAETIVFATTVGQRYRIRVALRTGNGTLDGTICVYNTPSCAPSNDEPCQATPLTVNTNAQGCSNVSSGTVLCATNSGQDNCGGSEDDDVWFRFVATGTVHNINILNVSSTDPAGANMYHAVYSGACGALSLIGCSDPDASQVSGLTPGNTYWIQVFTWTSLSGQNTTFNICLGTPPPPPANDSPCGATTVLTNSGLTCTNFATGTVQYATDSGLSNCTADSSTPDDDVWFKFVATSTSHSISIYNIAGSTIDMYHAVYTASGDPCSGGTLNLRAGSCSDLDYSALNGLTIGTTYYVQVYTWGPDPGQTSTFNICIGTPPPPPSNDNQCGAAVVTPNTNAQGCTNVTAGTTTSATSSTVGSCGIGSADDDVWFKFTATNTVHTISLLNITGATNNLVHAVYTTPCSTTSLIPGTCSNTNTSIVSGLTVGTTYLIQVYTWTSTPNQNVNFNVCVGTPPPSPTNNFCSAATALPCGTNSLSGSTVSTLAVTSSTGCTMSSYGVWYTFTGNGDYSTISVTSLGGYDVELAVASGSCGTLVNEGCRDAVTGAGTESFALVTTVGVTYYVYIAHPLPGNTTTGNFTISHTCSPVTPPANDEPCTATPLTVGTSCTWTNSTNAFANNSLGIPAPGCANYQGGDVWFTATVPANGAIQIDTNVGVVTDSGMAIYTAASCSGPFTLLECDDFDSPNGNMSLINIFALQPGSTLYIRVWEDGNNNNGSFRICATETTAPCMAGNGIGNTDVGCPNVLAGGITQTTPPPVDCGSGGCVDLQVNYLQLGEPTSYNIQSIPYDPPYQFDCLQNPISVNTDDVWSPIVNLPFDFCFYNNSYNQCLVGSNGQLTFDLASNTPGGFCAWSFDVNIPNSTDAATPENSIFGVGHDTNPGIGGRIGWELVTMNSDCRALVVAFHDVPMFGSGNSNIFYTGMMVLYENTNIIEVHIETKTATGWNSGNAVVGLQNISGGQAAVPPGRNVLDPNWTVTNESWRFVPSGTTITSVRWFEGSGTSGQMLGTTDVISVCPSSTTTYTAEVTYQLCTSPTPLVILSETTVEVNPSKTWNGSVSSDWSNNSNWTPTGVPDGTDCVVIGPTANDPVISDGTDAFAFTLNVQNGASVTIESDDNLSGGTLTLTDRLIVDPTGIFYMEDSSSLIQINGSSNTGNITMERDTNVRRQDYVYWSSPVKDYPLTSVSPNTSSSLIFEWIPTLDRPDGVGPPPGNVILPNDYGEWQVASGLMETAKGYIIRGPNNYNNNTPSVFTASFSGVPHNGSILHPIERGTYNGPDYYDQSPDTPVTSIDDNWNLVGNPYPSALDADPFLAANTMIDGTVYLWTHGTQIHPAGSENSPFYGTFIYNYDIDDYLEYNASGSNPPGFQGHIGSGQGFFVLMTEASAQNEDLLFDNTMRGTASDPNDQFFRTNGGEASRSSIQKDRIWLDLVLPSGKANTTLVAYAEGATNGIDRMFDAKINTGASKDLYSLIDGEKYIIQGRQFPFEVNDIVPIGITTDESGVFNIAIRQIDGSFETSGQEIYIEDLMLNTIHNLRNAPYTFMLSEAGTYNNRFLIRYSNESLDLQELETYGFNIISFKDHIKVTSGNSPIATVEIYDMLGRIIADYQDVNLLEFTFNLPNQSKGTLIVKASLENGQQKIKKVVY